MNAFYQHTGISKQGFRMHHRAVEAEERVPHRPIVEQLCEKRPRMSVNVMYGMGPARLP
jgi:hypothetical protein